MEVRKTTYAGIVWTLSGSEKDYVWWNSVEDEWKINGSEKDYADTYRMEVRKTMQE